MKALLIVAAIIFGVMMVNDAMRNPYAKQEPKSQLMGCMSLTENRAKMECMAANCQFDDPESNAPHCQPQLRNQTR